MDNVDRFRPVGRSYYKTNFVDILEKITPEFYQTDDIEVSGLETNPISQVINTHIKVANNISNILSISSVAGTQTKNLNNISGISQYFIKQNELTKITPYTFESKILLPLGYSFSNFESSSVFNTYLSSNLLPKIRLATGTQSHALEANKNTLSSLTLNANASSIHNYLVDNLGWFYFLNTSARGGLSYSPSSYVLESLNSLYLGNTLETVDGIKGLTEYLWRNNSVCSFGEFLPSNYISGTSDANLETSVGIAPTYTSGTQKLDYLKTLIDIVYSPLYIDKTDYTVKTAFNDFLDTGYYLTDTKSKGPYRKLLNILGFNFADISDQVENIGLIYDIQNVRDEHLQYLADLIGFRLRGNSPTKWRQQLAIAVDLYKRSGTLKAIQIAINALITDSILDVSGKVQELWESYLPQLIWYALYTESPLFKNLNTWTRGIALKGGIYEYSNNSIEDNIKIVVDSILLEMYKRFPDEFIFNGERFNPPRFYTVDKDGNELALYTIVGEPNMKPFHIYQAEGREFIGYRVLAKTLGQGNKFDAATAYGPLGYGVYMAGLDPVDPNDNPTYLKFVGDLNFLFNYRNKNNYPMPPFEEIKFYRDSSVTAEMVDFLVERLKCFKVREAFAEEVGTFLLENAVYGNTDLRSLNEWLMFFDSAQTPSNFNDVLSNVTEYDNDILSLWNGKSSHLFVNFQDSDFDFTNATMEGDGRNALYESARISKEFAPAHAIMRVNLAASATDDYLMSSTKYHYLELDSDDTRVSYTSASLLAGFQFSGVSISFAAGGGDAGAGSDGGRGGLNTFKRSSVNSITDSYLSSTASITSLGNVARRNIRRRNLKYVLPKESYYDRTGFNGPISFDPSTLERSMPSSIGELTLGYIPSAGRFHPIVDAINPSGVWNSCETLQSSRQFSGIYTSATFPYRGLSSLGSNAKNTDEGVSSSRYHDRGQVPQIYVTMNQLLEEKARSYAKKLIEADPSSFNPDAYWKNNVESLANQLITNGFSINSFSDYENFAFGNGIHKLYKDFCTYFNRHTLGLNLLEQTGGNIFAQVFGQGLFNCDFTVDGSAASNYISTSLPAASSINTQTVWNISNNGTYIASSNNDCVVPIIGSFTQGSSFCAEFRNPHILSGIEFCDASGSPVSNQFSIFRLDPSTAVKGYENYLVNNCVIKCKSLGGFPRLRFDLSAYGDRRNYFIKDHEFELRVNALVGDERSPEYGGGELGVWIHTKPVSGVFWSWTPQGSWTAYTESQLNDLLVKDVLCHRYSFNIEKPSDPDDSLICLNSFEQTIEGTNDLSLTNIKSKYLKTFSIKFDTRNFTTNNNYEYLQVLPISDENYIKVNQVHKDSTNYIVEVFFIPNRDNRKYLLIDSVELQDLTLRENAGIGTGFGIDTSGIPLKQFVQEDKVYLNKTQLRDILKFFNGLIGQDSGDYYTTLATRNAIISSGTMEVSGGSRLSYRVHPEWGPNSKGAANNYTRVEFDN